MGLTAKMVSVVMDYSDPKSLGSRFRRRRIGPLLAIIDRVWKEKGSVEIIDIGGTDTYWTIVPRDYLDSRRARITIVNRPGEPRPADYGPFRFVGGDGCGLDFADRSFDIAHSNSVIEHVGDWPRMRAFASEVTRVARHYFVQTPSYWFPIEPHCMTLFFHWLPLPWQIALCCRFQLGGWGRARSLDEAMFIVNSARLLDRRLFAALFPQAEVRTERVLLLPKSYIAVSR